MTIRTVKEISFGWEEIVAQTKSPKRRKTSPEMIKAAQRAFEEGRPLLEMAYSLEIFDVKGFDGNYIIISWKGCAEERLFIGQRIGYLYPAGEIAVALCTVGPKVVEAMRRYEKQGDYLMFYYLDAFGVRALKEVSQNMRDFVADYAASKERGVGPSMQPGSVAGWSVRGQNDLYRLADGFKIGLTLNEESLLVPHLSNSALIGIGKEYSAKSVGSMCHECPRRETCLWRREMKGEDS